MDAAVPPPPPPPEPPSAAAPSGARRPKVPLWSKFLIGVAVLLVGVITAGFVIHVPYATISPGAAVPLKSQVHVEGAQTYPASRGDIRLLFVRERIHVNLWQYLQGKLDKNVELYKDSVLNPQKKTQTQRNQESIQEMTDAKTAATKVALDAAGYKVETAPGLEVIGLTNVHLPVAKILQLGDTLVAADGHKIKVAADLTKAVRAHEPGQEITLDIVRDGKAMTVHVPLSKADNEPIIGIFVSPRYRFPVKVSVDTGAIGGPSGGLAMALAILDDLTPGNLTGGQRVAVTGTIDPAGHVGEIGAITQKAVAVRASGATLFIVPQCNAASDPPAQLAACRADIQQVIKRVGSHTKVVPVSTFTQALEVLRENGGSPVTPVASGRAA